MKVHYTSKLLQSTEWFRTGQELLGAIAILEPHVHGWWEAMRARQADRTIRPPRHMYHNVVRMLYAFAMENFCKGSLEHVLKPMSLLKRDETGGEMNHREIVLGLAFPTHQQSTEAIVPAVGAFDDPASRLAPHAPEQRRLSASADVRDDAPLANGRFGIEVIVALVQAQMPEATRATRSAQDDGVEHVGHQPFVVDVGPGDHGRHRHPASVRENVSLHAEFAAVRRIAAGVAPPLGALTVALSSEDQSQRRPR